MTEMSTDLEQQTMRSFVCYGEKIDRNAEEVEKREQQKTAVEGTTLKGIMHYFASLRAYLVTDPTENRVGSASRSPVYFARTTHAGDSWKLERRRPYLRPPLIQRRAASATVSRHCATSLARSHTRS